MRLTAPGLQTLRKRPHRTKLWFSIYQPKTIFTARVTGTYSTGDTEISYYDPDGGYTNTYPNMQVLVGTSSGEDDVDRIRLRSATGTYATFAENSITWKTGQFLTFIDYINIDAVFPKIIQDPNDDENVIFYKDDDIPYSNQNSVYGTFPNAGSHRAGFIETGTFSAYWCATGTVNVAGQGITYSWAFEGGTPTGSTAFEPGWVSYDTVGHYKTRLITTAANGVTDTTYRYVSVYERPEEGSTNPVRRWALNDLSGSRAEGGYVANVRVWDELGAIAPNALIVLFADDWYGDEYTSLGGAKNNSKIVFVGYILKDSIQFNYREGWAEFDIGSPSEAMKQAEGFSVSCESKADPATWFQLAGMTTPRALYHYLRWHSTILNVTDFQYTGDARKVQYFDTDRSSLYDAINSFMTEGMIGEVTSDRQGKLWAEISDTGYENPFVSLRLGNIMQKHDWIGEPRISERRVAEASFVEMGGIVYQGDDSGAFQALLTNAPSITPLYRGKTDGSKQGLILKSQSQLNQLGGNYLAHKNSSIEDVALALAGNYRHLDIAPQERLFLLVSESDAPNSETLIGKQFKMTSMNWLYNPERESFYPDIALAPLVTGSGAQTVIIPPAPPSDGYDYPDFELPPLPYFPSTTPTAPQLFTTAFVMDTSHGILYTVDLDSEQPTWFIWNAGITENHTDVSQIFVTPNGSVWVASFELGELGIRRLYYAPSIGSVFSVVVDHTWVDGEIGGGNDAHIMAVGYNPNNPEEIGIAIDNNAGTGKFAIGDHSGFAVTGDINPGDSTRAGVFFNNNKWFAYSGDFATSTRFNRLSAAGSLEKTHVIAECNVMWAPDKNLPLIYGIDESTSFKRSSDDGETFTENTLPKSLFWQAPSGQNAVGLTNDGGRFLMYDFGDTHAGKSTDYGYSFSQITNLPVQSKWFFSPIGSPSKWIAVGASYIYTTSNFGASWQRKDTFIPEFLIPFPNFRNVYAVPTA